MWPKCLPSRTPTHVTYTPVAPYYTPCTPFGGEPTSPCVKCNIPTAMINLSLGGMLLGAEPPGTGRLGSRLLTELIANSEERER